VADPVLPPRGALQALEILEDGVMILDGDRRVVYMNPAASRITGLDRDGAEGMRCSEVLRSDRCGGDCLLDRSLASGKVSESRRVQMVDALGSRRLLSMRAMAAADADGGLAYAVEVFRDLSSSAGLSGIEQVGGLYSMNRRMLEIFELVPLVADSGSSVLLCGESGTGKELLARAIHDSGPRSGGPFVPVNCAAIPDTLLESELFGHRRGAFTDARSDKPGRFELARGGTIFLDEIGDLSPAIQAKLLRVLQDGSYLPLGAVEEERTDARVIAATNRPIEDMVDAGEFRADLYYRINVVRIDIPPLRERMEDVPLLVEHFVSRFNAALDRDVEGVTDAALSALMAYDYPGNVRELENVIERAFVLCREGQIDLRHLPGKLVGGAKPPAEGEDGLERLEASYLMNVLRRNGWNRARTARELGIHKTTLYRKMKRYGIEAPSSGSGRASE
jgi:PAS domain S-box-containing protein